MRSVRPAFHAVLASALASTAAAVVLAMPSLPAAAEDTTSPSPSPTTETPSTPPTDPEPPKYVYTPASTILYTDPVKSPRGITSQLVRLIDNVPDGESIEVITYFLGSPAIKNALIAAFERGVEVRMVLESHTRSANPQGVELSKYLAKNTSDNSWVKFSSGATRGSNGAVHQKTWRFSQVGTARWVTVTGSYNASDLADSRAHSLMWQWVSKSIYDTFANVWASQVKMVNQSPSLRVFNSTSWNAYFSPLTSKTSSGDPVMRRLASIPANKNTTIRIAMFSMWDTRGNWIAARLASMARKGTRIVFLAGPTVSSPVVKTLRNAGVAVYPGCFKDGTYTHSKDMSATYISGGKRVYWTWLGSDNWTTNGMDSDEAVLGISNYTMHSRFVSLFESVRKRTGGVYGSACQPKGE